MSMPVFMNALPVAITTFVVIGIFCQELDDAVLLTSRTLHEHVHASMY